MTTLARLKPHNAKKGHTTRVYMIAGRRFLEDKGWYEVPDALASALKDLHQNHYDDESPFLFDVASEEDAEKLDLKEEEARQNARASARNPQRFKGKQRTQVYPTNNAGGLAGLPDSFSTADLYNPINGVGGSGPGATSDPDSDRNDSDFVGNETDEEGRQLAVGRVKPRHKK